jgi:hypothetical protein
MVCQLDDCVDVLKVLHGNRYDFMFLFDHSCGHDKKRSDRLTVENMKKYYGGKQPIMQDATIKSTYGYLGNFPSTLKEGDIQQMHFQEGDIGPFWMSPQEWENKKYDKTSEKKKRELTMKELTEKLSEQGYMAPGRKNTLQQAAEARGIPTIEEYEDMVKGWLGKPKGLLQVCWE